MIVSLFKVRETVSQLRPADTVTGCAPVMSAHEKKGGETGKNIPETQRNHLDKVMKEAGKMREDFQRVALGVVF